MARMAESATTTQPSESKPGISFFGVVKSFNPTLRDLLVSDILIRDRELRV